MLNEEMIYDEAFAEKVKKSFWRDGLIVMMPSQLKKRKVLLEPSRRSTSRSWTITTTTARYAGSWWISGS